MDTSQYKELFITESMEQLDHINQTLLILEKNPSDHQALSEIFRTIHTLKGMAATMGFDHITELTHFLENILDKYRTKERDLSSNSVDILFECLDTLALLVEEISTGQSKKIDLGVILKKLAILEKGEEEVVASSKVKTNIFQDYSEVGKSIEHLEDLVMLTEKDGYATYGIKVELSKTCNFKGVRAFMVYKSISKLGEVVASLPEAKELQEGLFEYEFVLIVVSKDATSDFEENLNQISEVEKFSITQLNREDLEKFLKAITSSGNNEGDNIAETDNNSSSQKVSNRSFQSIRVSIERLDTLQNLVGELVVNKIRFYQLAHKYNINELKEALSQFERVINELQDEVTEVRMVPMEHIFNRFPRMVRDLARESGKKINLEMQGKEIELDRTVLDEINEPLVHLLRNAIDHGIEVPEKRGKAKKDPIGTIKLIASREKNHVVIKVVDDGKGIDTNKIRRLALQRNLFSKEEMKKMSEQEIINLIALPNFSTAEEVTEVSGRGVGVDAVRSRILSFGGSLYIESIPGQGSTFTLRLPMTLAIIQALLVKIHSEIYAIPVINTLETINFADTLIKRVKHKEVFTYRDRILPLFRLRQLLDLDNNLPESNERNSRAAILVVEMGEDQVGLLVDQVLGQQEIAIKSLNGVLKAIKGFSGVTILGDGKIALVLDVPSLL